MNAYVIGILVVGLLSLLIVLTQVKILPLQWAGKLVFHFALGVFYLFFLNLLGGYFDLSIPFNLITIAIAGLLGLPGVICLVCIKMFII